MKHLQLISGYKMNLIKKSTYTEAEFIEMLEKLESGHTDGDYCIDPNQKTGKPPKNVLKAKLKLNGKTIPFRLAGDTKYKSVSAVLRKLAKGGKLGVVLGLRDGVKLGVDGEFIETFQFYLTDKKQKEFYKAIIKSKKLKKAS